MFTKNTVCSILLIISIFQIVRAGVNMTTANNEVAGILQELNNANKLANFNKYIDSVNGAKTLDSLKKAAENILDFQTVEAYKKISMTAAINDYETAFRKILQDGGYKAEDITYNDIPIMGALNTIREYNSRFIAQNGSTYDYADDDEE